MLQQLQQMLKGHLGKRHKELSQLVNQQIHQVWGKEITSNRHKNQAQDPTCEFYTNSHIQQNHCQQQIIYDRKLLRHRPDFQRSPAKRNKLCSLSSIPSKVILQFPALFSL